jgi:hypothetical protein
MNWCVQATGGEIHDCVLVLVERAVKKAGFTPQDYRFYGSCHDDLAWLVRTSLSEEFCAIVKEAHAKTWEMFFQAIGFDDAPSAVKENIVMNVDRVWRKEVDLWVPDHVDYQLDIPNGYNIY